MYARKGAAPHGLDISFNTETFIYRPIYLCDPVLNWTVFRIYVIADSWQQCCVDKYTNYIHTQKCAISANSLSLRHFNMKGENI